MATTPSPATENKPTLALVGAGHVGTQLVTTLSQAGWPIAAIYDLHQTEADRAALKLEARHTQTLAETAQAAEVILTAVTDDRAMELIFAAEGNSLLSAATGKLFINTSTVHPDTSTAVSAAVTAAGGQAVEACLIHDREGALAFLCSGPEPAYKRAQPILAAITPRLHYVGGTGEAAKFKLLISLSVNAQTALLAELLSLAHAAGVELETARGIFSQTEANSQVLALDGLAIQKGDYTCRLSVANAAKDCGIALTLAKTAGLRLPLVQAAESQFNLLLQKGLGELDKTAVADLTFPGRMRPPLANV